MCWAKTFSLGVIVCALLSACSHVQDIEPSKIDPPLAETRKRLSQIVLRVYSDAKPSWHANEDAIVGAGDGAAHGAKSGVKAGLVGLVPAAAGCHRDWRELWPITCPLGIVVGIGTGIAGAVVGGAGGAAYGAIAAPSPEAMKAAVANLDKAVQETRVENALRVQLVRTIQQSTSSAIVEDEPTDDVGVGESLPIGKAPIILAIQVDEFSLAQKGGLSPDLSLSFQVSGGLYDAPKVVPIHERGWVLETKLGDFVGLLEGDGSALQKKFAEVLEEVATAIINDIFLTYESRLIASDPEADEVGRILAKFSAIKNTNVAEYDNQKQKSACGDSDAQLELGKAYAAVDGRIYGRRARESWVEAYKWLKLAHSAGKEEAESSISKVQLTLTPTEIAAAERFISEFNPRECPKEFSESAEPKSAAFPSSSVAELQSPGEVHATLAPEIKSKETPDIARNEPLTSSSTINFDRERFTIIQTIADFYDRSTGSNDFPDWIHGAEFIRMEDIDVLKIAGDTIGLKIQYIARSVHSGNDHRRLSEVTLRKREEKYEVTKFKSLGKV